MVGGGPLDRPLRLLFAAAVLAPAAHAGFDEGSAAMLAHDWARAHAEFAPLARAGDARAQHGLGMLYDEGRGVPADHAAAVRWYRAAAEQGHAEAQLALGRAMQRGDGVARDPAGGLAWILKSAAQGDGKAQYEAALACRDGIGTARNPVHAYAWLLLAAQQSHPGAQIAGPELLARLTPVQQHQARLLALGWRPGQRLPDEVR